MRTILTVSAGVIGACVGSFLNVVIHRIPLGESVVSPPSRCPSCITELRPRDNIPLVSYVLLRGRCRTCRVPISVRYPLVESATAAIWVGALMRFDKLEEASFVAISSTVLLALTFIDLEHRRLPNVIVLPGIAVMTVWVAVAALAQAHGGVVIEALFSGGAAFALLFAIAFVSGGMGLGDVKLGAFIGVVAGRFGWEVAVGAILAAFILGGLIALALLALGRKGRKDSIPFGPALAAGAVLALFAGAGPVNAWLGR